MNEAIGKEVEEEENEVEEKESDAEPISSRPPATRTSRISNPKKMSRDQ